MNRTEMECFIQCRLCLMLASFWQCQELIGTVTEMPAWR